MALALAASPVHAEPAADPGAASDPATAAIRFYQDYLSSLRHVRCQFSPSCSEYAAQAIERYGVIEGSARAADRLMRCNESARHFHPKTADGRLDDPVDDSQPPSTAARAPFWLLPPPEPADPPLAADVDAARRARIDETAAFARVLERRGDCERASTEYQRIGSIAGDPATDAWAFERIGGCQFGASRWAEAERSFLTAGMLAATPGGRARAVYRAAVARFDAGSFAVCARLLATEALAPPPELGGVTPVSAEPGVPAAFPAALSGLCGFAMGDWSQSNAELRRAGSLAPDADTRERIGRLLPFVARGRGLPERSPGFASALSAVVPGSGQIYAGHTRDGVRHLLFNGAMIWSIVALARGGHGAAAAVVGVVELPFYLGNVRGAGIAAKEFDRARRVELLSEATRESSR